MFQLHEFKQYLYKNITQDEKKFMVHTFFRASKMFFFFGLLVLFSLILGHEAKLLEKFATNSSIRYLVMGGSLLCAVLYFWRFQKYENDVLGVDKVFVKKMYALLFLSHIFIFFLSLSTIQMIAFGSDRDSLLKICALTIVIFGTAVVVYLVPAIFGALLIKRESAMKLCNFLKYCYLAYLVMFVILLVSSLFAMNGSFETFHLVLFALSLVISIVSPVLTWYRISCVSKEIDYSDEVSVEKWKDFFALEITYELIRIAVHIIRIILQSLNRR